MTQGYPSQNPAETGGLAGLFRSVLNKFLQNLDDCLPARVVSYDRKKNTATVRPMLAVLTTDGGQVSRAEVASVPVLALGGGNFVVNFPLKKGDLGWIKASDRDISLFKQNLAEARPNTLRKHSFEDALFIPDVYRQYEINGEDMDENMVIQSLDGKIRVSLWPDRVKTTAEQTSLEVNANGVITGIAPISFAIESGPTSQVVNSDGTITSTAPASVFFNTPLVTFAGQFVSGTGYGGQISKMDGGLETTMDQVAGEVSTMHHTHTCPQCGHETSPPNKTGSGV